MGKRGLTGMLNKLDEFQDILNSLKIRRCITLSMCGNIGQQLSINYVLRSGFATFKKF